VGHRITQAVPVRVDLNYNRRRHGTLEMMTPAEFEQARYTTVNREPQPA
jgi:hypothetical protein